MFDCVRSADELWGLNEAIDNPIVFADLLDDNEILFSGGLLLFAFCLGYRDYKDSTVREC